MSEIKPCPFCGSEINIGGEDALGYWWNCSKCEIGSSRYFKSAAEAIADANRRAPHPLEAIAAEMAERISMIAYINCSDSDRRLYAKYNAWKEANQ